MLQALVFGSDSLQLVQDKKKTIIAPKTEQKFFKIGHSSASSETFIPEFYIDLQY